MKTTIRERKNNKTIIKDIKESGNKKMRTINYNRFLIEQRKYFGIKALLGSRKRRCRKRDPVSEKLLIQMDINRWKNLIRKKILTIQSPRHFTISI